MFTRLTAEKLMAVRRALAAGMRHVEIARELDLSVWTIARIHDAPDTESDPLQEEDLPVDDAPPDYAAANLRRCGGCGAMVYHWPCIACTVRGSPRVPPAEEVDDLLEDVVGWDRPESREWGVGSRTRRTKGNGAYRAKLAAAGRVRAGEAVSAG